MTDDHHVDPPSTVDTVVSMRPKDGSIPYCPHAGCGFRCCEFQQGNFIVMYPGEAERANEAGMSLKHLELTERPSGGYNAVCKAADTASCDRGYKPLDCKSYPFFPTVDDSDKIVAGLKGAKCPLTVEMVDYHAEWIVKQWISLSDEQPDIKQWLKTVRLVGYDTIT